MVKHKHGARTEGPAPKSSGNAPITTWEDDNENTSECGRSRCAGGPDLSANVDREGRYDQIVLAETPSDEFAAYFVALDRAKANGPEYERTAFSD